MKTNLYNVKLLPIAEEDLTELIAYLAKKNLKAAEELASQIEEKISSLSYFPWRGSVPHDKDIFELGYRFLVIEAYLIFYTVENKTVFVHRILHGARDYLSLLE